MQRSLSLIKSCDHYLGAEEAEVSRAALPGPPSCIKVTLELGELL